MSIQTTAPKQILHYSKAVMKSFLVLAVMISCGLGSSLIQMGAWITMIPAQWIATQSIEQAIENTIDIDGAHACSLCKAAAALRGEEDHTETNKQLRKPKAQKPSQVLGFSHHQLYRIPSQESEHFPLEFSTSPPTSVVIDLVTPPPRHG